MRLCIKCRAALLVIALVSCTPGHSDPVDAQLRTGAGVDILFIGNSLTYVNDLPGTIAAMAAAAGDTVRVTTVALPNLALIDHVTGSSNAIEVIRRGGWEFVVLQQAGTSTGPGVFVDTLVLATTLLDKEVRAQGGRTALYMTWPTIDRVQFFDNTRYAYQTAAQAVGGIFLPAGEAWRTAWRSDASLIFYSPGGLHPTPLGTYLAALVIYEGLRGKDVRTLAPTAFVAGVKLGITEDLVRLLQRAAHETVAASK